MAAVCNFNITFTQPAQELVGKLQVKVSGQGGTFTGNETNGTIKVPIMGSHISGSYTITGQSLNIQIDHKPFFISCDQIQGVLVGNI
jgi:hypothetical protein